MVLQTQFSLKIEACLLNALRVPVSRAHLAPVAGFTGVIANPLIPRP